MEELTSTLSTKILMMMAGFYDKLHPAGDGEFSKAMIAATKIAADGIAEKLTLALAPNDGELTAKIWKEFVAAATQNAFIEFPDEGPMIKLAEHLQPRR